MFRTIVAGYDGSEQARDGLVLAQRLRDPDGGRLVVVAVVHLTPGVMVTADDGLVADATAKARELLDEAATHLDAGVPCELVPVGSTSAARGIDQVATEKGADLIVLGSTHRHGPGVFTGRTTVQRLLHGAPCAVAVASAHAGAPLGPDGRIAVAFDASPEAHEALRVAYGLAERFGAPVDVLRAADVIVTPWGFAPGMDIAETLEADRRIAHEQVAEAVAQAPAGVTATGHVLEGATTKSLLAAANGASLLVTGSRSYGPLQRVLVGSVSIGLLTHGSVPVLVTPRRHDHGQAAGPRELDTAAQG